MAANDLKLLSGRVKKVPPTEVDANRYDWLNLQNAEPDLGVPSSNGSFFVSTVDGTRSWTDKLNTTANGISVNGELVSNSLTVADSSDLGDISNVKISGGNVDQVISTDGAGNLTFVDQEGGVDGGQTPTFIPEGETFTVVEDRQAFFQLPIEVDGDLTVDGVLIEIPESGSEQISKIENGNSEVIVDANSDVRINVAGTSNVLVAKSSGVDINGIVTVSGNIVPDANNTHSLGTPDKIWKEIYLGANTLFIDNTPLSVANGSLTFNNNAVVVSNDPNVNTDDVTEGEFNLYFTETRARNSFSAGAGIDIAGGTISVDSNISTKSYADNAANVAASAIVDSAPETLNTLNELASALGDDSNFATTIANDIGNKADKEITLSAGNGLAGGGNLSANFSISHANTSSQSSVNNSDGTVIQSINVDTYGHVTSIGSKSLSAPDIAYDNTANELTATDLQDAIDEIVDNAKIKKYFYTATASQTTFTGADDSGAVLAYSDDSLDVFINGVRLSNADYTATDGTSVVLDTGANANDEVAIVAYGFVLGGSGAKTFTATVTGSNGASDWTGSDPYVATITVSGILSTDRPIVDLDMSSVTFADVQSVLDEWSLVYRVEASANDEIKLYATAQPSEDFDINIQVNR